MKPPFIYALVDPLELEHVRYVGMAMSQNRPQQHVEIARKGVKTYVYNWIRALLAMDREPVILIIEQCSKDMTRKDIGEREKYHIKRLREDGHALTNTAEGGYGGITREKGWKHSPASIDKMKRALLGRTLSTEHKAKIGAASKAAWSNPELREKIIASRLGYEHSAETIAKMTGQKRSEEAKIRMSEALKGHHCSKETRHKISASNKGRSHSAEARAKMIGRTPWNKGRSSSIEERQSNSLAHKGQIPWNTGKQHSAETKAKISAARKRKVDANPS